MNDKMKLPQNIEREVFMLKISIDTLDKLQSLSQSISAVTYMQQLVSADKYDNLTNQYDFEYVRDYALYILREQEFDLTKQLYELVTDDNFSTTIAQSIPLNSV